MIYNAMLSIFQYQFKMNHLFINIIFCFALALALGRATALVKVTSEPSVAAFRRVGSFQDHVVHAHLVLEFDVPRERAQPSILYGSVQTLADNSSKIMWASLLHRIDPLIYEWKQLDTLLGAASPRPKRQVLLAVGVVASAGLGAWALAETYAVKSRVDALEDSNRHLIHSVSDVLHEERRMSSNMRIIKGAVTSNSLAIMSWETFDIASRAASESICRLERRAEGFRALLSHRFSPHLVEPVRLQAMYRGFIAKIHAQGYKCLIQSVDQLFHEDTSFVREGDKLYVIIKVPVVQADMDAAEPWHLYEHLPLPVQHKGAIHLVQAHGTFLAVDMDRSAFVDLEQSQLHSCSRSGHDFRCSTGFPRLRGGENGCLTALFLEHRSAAAELCKTVQLKEKNAVFRVNATSFLLWAQEERAVLVSNAETSETVTVTGLVLIELEAGCTAVTDEFKFTAQAANMPEVMHVVVQVPSLNLNWTKPEPIRNDLGAFDDDESWITDAEEELAKAELPTTGSSLADAAVVMGTILLVLTLLFFCFRFGRGLFCKASRPEADVVLPMLVRAASLRLSQRRTAPPPRWVAPPRPLQGPVFPEMPEITFAEAMANPVFAAGVDALQKERKTKEEEEPQGAAQVVPTVAIFKW
jgi:hypothetical protein